MTAQARASSGGGIGVLAALLAGVVALSGGLLLPAVAAIETVAQPIPPQPTVAIPPPAVTYCTGLGTVFLIADADLEIEGKEVLPSEHASEKHGIAMALAVRAAAVAAIIANPQLGKQPPCPDGRTRIVFPMGKEWGVWVLEKIGDSLYKEITAFKTSNQGYAKGISDDCGTGWWGHAYAQ
jgi:hypothetical protein